MAADKKPQLEASMKRLEAIVSDLEKGEHSLEESLKRFEEGLTLGKECRKILDQAELRVKRLIGIDENGELETEDMPSDD